ncbi:predicted protein [Uncinocarpus reesii 1704]|uniref:Major facilitator superfamily (MFS) profile domain-containing protein n=1 Tax=Uncinocarpus reesii (strain UAMH 1704) TaxID=336963 RepID=C4JLV2_UNCRE|nr:uncharacterized protein UREG_03810 [Uncinocarpus reesii 1704]EEP78964.1 predicted protein [Uncinocarpus reesii 1704]
MASFQAHFTNIRLAFNRRLFLSCCLIAFSQFNFGFDQTAFSTTQAMNAFERKFGVYNPAKKKWALEPSFLSLLNALPYIGFFAGVFIGSSISSRFGRRMVMFTMSLHALVSVPITVTSTNKAHILTARILNYIYLGMELAVVPVFQAEIVPPQVRGLVVATYQGCIYVGGLVMSLICRGTSTLEGNAQWQIPLALFAVIPAIVAILIWFIPESPRWLLLKDRPEDSLNALRALREGKFTEDEILSEFNALKVRLARESEKGKYLELYRGPDLKRTMISIGMNVFLQVTGQVFTARYGTVYIKSLGTVDPFVMTIVNQAVNLFAIGVSMVLVDHIGRRPLLFFSGFMQVATWFCMAGLGTPHTKTHAMQTGLVALISVYNFGFCTGWAPLSHTVAAELPTSRLRDMTFRTANAVNIILQLVITLVIPYLMDAQYANLGSKVGYIFGPASILAMVFTYYCVPETKGKSLEDLDVLFVQGVPIRDFKSPMTVDYSKDGLEVETVKPAKESKAPHVEIV